MRKMFLGLLDVSDLFSQRAGCEHTDDQREVVGGLAYISRRMH